MAMMADLRALTRSQRNAVIASYLGWTLDAFDFFLLVLIIKNIAGVFASPVSTVAWAITLTLAMRLVGALIFGRLADRCPILMLDDLLFSLFELLTAFAPSLWAFFLLRTLFGIALGGARGGVGASLALETIPPGLRGLIPGFLQKGYASGYLLASAVFAILYNLIGWLGMFIIGVVPAHLNELSPEGVRGTFPGLTYQLGNLLAAVNAPIQASIAESRGNDYAFAMAITAGIVAIAVAVPAYAGREAKGVAFGQA